MEGDAGDVASESWAAAVLSGNLQRAAFSVHERQHDAGDTWGEQRVNRVRGESDGKQN